MKPIRIKVQSAAGKRLWETIGRCVHIDGIGKVFVIGYDDLTQELTVEPVRDERSVPHGKNLWHWHFLRR